MVANPRTASLFQETPRCEDRRAIRSVGAGTILQTQRNTRFVWFADQPADGHCRSAV